MKTETVIYQIVGRSTFEDNVAEEVFLQYETDDLTSAVKELDRLRAEIEPYYRIKYRLERVTETTEMVLISGESR